jgi:subtilase family serine protease
LTSAAATNGANQTIAIVDAYDDPNAEADLQVYRAQFGLPVCSSGNGCFMKVNQNGMAGSYPFPNTGWAQEISLDLDMASAICPNCEIVLVEANDNNGSNLYAAEDTAATTCGATVISNSWDGPEYPTETNDEVHFDHPGVAISVAAGDNGYANAGDGYPVSSAFVTAVGGTNLCNLRVCGSTSETVWSSSGGDCSQFIAQPAWQSAYNSSCGMRIANDVAAVADPSHGVAVYDTYGGTHWLVFGGTSVATPVISSVYALAQNSGSISDGSYSYSHTGSLNDITLGSNGSCPAEPLLCNAGPGYDGPSGNGSPNGVGGF